MCNHRPSEVCNAIALVKKGLGEELLMFQTFQAHRSQHLRKKLQEGFTSAQAGVPAPAAPHAPPVRLGNPQITFPDERMPPGRASETDLHDFGMRVEDSFRFAHERADLILPLPVFLAPEHVIMFCFLNEPGYGKTLAHAGLAGNPAHVSGTPDILGEESRFFAVAVLVQQKLLRLLVNYSIETL